MAQRLGDGPGTASVETAHRELERGKKIGHWIWYVFPQRDGLGWSERSRRFAVCSESELQALLDDAEVRVNLVRAFALAEATLAKGLAMDLFEMFEQDARKVVSSATLFREHLRRRDDLPGDLEILGRASQSLLTTGLAIGIPPCAKSLRGPGIHN